MLIPMSMGCVSKMVFDGSKQQVALRKATITNNETAIKAIKLGDDGVGVGIDVSNWEALKERPWKQAGAAILDAIIISVAKDAIDNLNKDSGSGGDANVNISVSESDDTSISVSTERDDIITTDNSDHSDDHSTPVTPSDY